MRETHSELVYGVTGQPWGVAKAACTHELGTFYYGKVLAGLGLPLNASRTSIGAIPEAMFYKTKESHA